MLSLHTARVSIRVEVREIGVDGIQETVKNDFLCSDNEMVLQQTVELANDILPEKDTRQPSIPISVFLPRLGLSWAFRTSSLRGLFSMMNTQSGKYVITPS